MTEGLRGRLLAIFLAPLIGYIVGWILGWNAVDPNLDIWALAAAVGALAGLGIALTQQFWRFAGSLIGMTTGMFAAWVLKTALLGEQTSLLGFLIAVAGGVLGLLAGSHPMFRHDGHPLRILVTALLVGYVGGFILNVLILRLWLGWIQSSTVLTYTPGILSMAIVGAIIASAWRPARDADAASTDGKQVS